MHFDPLSRFRNDASCTPFNNTFGYTVYKNSLEIDNIDPGHGGRSDDLLQYLFHNAKEMGLIKIEDEKVYEQVQVQNEVKRGGARPDRRRRI